MDGLDGFRDKQLDKYIREGIDNNDFSVKKLLDSVTDDELREELRNIMTRTIKKGRIATFVFLGIACLVIASVPISWGVSSCIDKQEERKREKDLQARNGCELTLVGDGYEVTGVERSKTNLEIPSTYKGKPITSIGDNAFSNRDSLTSVTIPDSVTCIGEWAFYDCDGLASIIIPDSVTTIDSYAFRNCDSLIGIGIPDSVTSIGLGVFKDCDSLAEITIPFVGETKGGTSHTNFGYIFGAQDYIYNSSCVPDSLKKVTITSETIIDSFSFYACKSLTSVGISDSVTSIGKTAFYGCSSLEKMTLPFVGATKGGTSNTHFGYIFGATYYHELGYVPGGLKEVMVTSANSIGSYAFYALNLRSITLGDSVAIIEDRAFNGCEFLESIIIPNSVTSIGSFVFAACDSLTNIVIPDSVTNIGAGIVNGCDNIQNIIFNDTSTWYRTTSKTSWEKKSGGAQADITDSSKLESFFYYDTYYWYKL